MILILQKQLCCTSSHIIIRSFGRRSIVTLSLSKLIHFKQWKDSKPEQNMRRRSFVIWCLRRRKTNIKSCHTLSLYRRRPEVHCDLVLVLSLPSQTSPCWPWHWPSLCTRHHTSYPTNVLNLKIILTLSYFFSWMNKLRQLSWRILYWLRWNSLHSSHFSIFAQQLAILLLLFQISKASVKNWQSKLQTRYGWFKKENCKNIIFDVSIFPHQSSGLEIPQADIWKFEVLKTI